MAKKTTHAAIDADGVRKLATALDAAALVAGGLYDSLCCAAAVAHALTGNRPPEVPPEPPRPGGWCDGCEQYDLDLVAVAGQHLCPGCVDQHAMEQDQQAWYELEQRMRPRRRAA